MAKRNDPRGPSRPHRLGALGEAEAARHLQAAGYRILDRNVRSGGVEIDLVATRGRVLAFVEVKTRATRRAGSPEDAVDSRKQARLVRGAVAWLREHGARGRTVRFDVASVEPDCDGRLQVTHRTAAFDASGG